MPLDSTTILTSLLENLEAYQIANFSDNEYSFIYEDEIRSDDQLDQRSENPGFIIGFDEADAIVNVRTQSGISNRAEQNYQIKIFFKIPRENDYTEIVARPIRDFKDIILDWLNQPLDTLAITSNLLYTLNYVSNTGVDRTDSYATMTINLEGFRNVKNFY